MAKTVLISNRTYGNMDGVGKDYIHDSGVAFTAERYFGIVNETFDYQLKLKCRPLYWFVNWWYATTDYKKNKSMSDQKMTRAALYERIFYWLCVACLIIVLIMGFVRPVIQASQESFLLIEGKMNDAAIWANGDFLGYVFSNSSAAGELQAIYNVVSKNPEYQHIFELAHRSWTDIEPIKIGSTFMILGITPDMQFALYQWMTGHIVVPGSPVHIPWDTHYLTEKGIILSTDSVGQAYIIPQIWDTFFREPGVIAAIVFTFFFLIVIIAYAYRRKHVTPKVNAMSMQAYLAMKLDLARKFRFFLKRRIPMVKGIKELNHRFVFNSAGLGGGQIYFNAQLMNYMYATFKDMNVVMVVDEADDASIEMLQKICDQDFNQNIQLIIVDTDKVNTFKSKDGYGYLLSDHYVHALNQDIEGFDIVDDQDNLYFDKLTARDGERVSIEHNLRQQQIDTQKHIQKFIFKNRRV